MLIVDSQVHIWENAKLGAHHRQIPVFSKDDLLAEMDAAGVSAAVINPPFTLPQVNDLATEAARQHPQRLAVMGFFPFDKPESPELFKQWMKRPGMLGLRWVVNQPDYARLWRDGTLDWLWKAAARDNVPLAFNTKDFEGVGLVAERNPGTRIAIDHMGRVLNAKDDAGWADLDEMLALAKYPNVFIKVSGAPSNSSDVYPYRNIHGHIRRIIETFGPARCFWGTDITRIHNCTWRQCVTMFTEEMPWLKGRDLELVMGRALCDWLGWKLRA